MMKGNMSWVWILSKVLCKEGESMKQGGKHSTTESTAQHSRNQNNYNHEEHKE